MDSVASIDALPLPLSLFASAFLESIPANLSVSSRNPYLPLDKGTSDRSWRHSVQITRIPQPLLRPRSTQIPTRPLIVLICSGDASMLNLQRPSGCSASAADTVDHCQLLDIRRGGEIKRRGFGGIITSRGRDALEVVPHCPLRSTRTRVIQWTLSETRTVAPLQRQWWTSDCGD